MMEQGSGRGIAGGLGLFLGYLAVTGLLLWGTAGAVAAVRAPGRTPVGAEVAVAAAVGAWAVLTWLTAATLAALATAVVAGVASRAHQRALTFAPTAARRLAGVLLGLTLASAPVVTAAPGVATERAPSVSAGSPSSERSIADPHRADPASHRASTPRLPSLDRPVAGAPLGWTPDRPAHAHPRTTTSGVHLVSVLPRRGRDADTEVVVRRGDTLWDIAAAHLGAGASAAEIALEWPRWYAANRAEIGADPDLLLPGQRLVPPT